MLPRSWAIAALAMSASAAADNFVLHGHLESIQSGAYEMSLTAQAVSVKVRTGDAGAIALRNGTPFAVSLDRGSGPVVTAQALANEALACKPSATAEPYRLRIHDGVAQYEQWISAHCGEMIQLMADEALPIRPEVTP